MNVEKTYFRTRLKINSNVYKAANENTTTKILLSFNRVDSFVDLLDRWFYLHIVLTESHLIYLQANSSETRSFRLWNNHRENQRKNVERQTNELKLELESTVSHLISIVVITSLLHESHHWFIYQQTIKNFDFIVSKIITKKTNEKTLNNISSHLKLSRIKLECNVDIISISDFHNVFER